MTVSVEQCVEECLWNGPWNCLTSLSCGKRQSCTHVHWVCQATVHFSALPKSLEVLAVLFFSPFIQSSVLSLALLSPPLLALLKPDIHCSRKRKAEGMIQARGTFLFLCLVMLPGRTWPGSFYWLLGCLQREGDDVRPSHSLSPTTVFFCTFDPMTFTTIIHCSSELFCSA